MIKGGTSAAGKTGAIRTGYTQMYIPCELVCYSKAVQTKLENTARASVYNALVKIETLTGEQQILTSCSYFQVQKYLSSGMDSAFLTIQKPEVWSIWGSKYTNLLKPSKRTVTIYAGIPGNEMPIFRGRITGVAEVQGANGGAINLTCSDTRITLQRTIPIQLEQPHSRYCEIHRLANAAFKEAGQVLAIADSDTSGVFTPSGDSLASVAQALSGQPVWVSGDVMAVSSGSALQILGDGLMLINDAVITSATRDFYDSNAFNTVTIQGMLNNKLVTEQIFDANDVSERGRVAYSTVIGSEFDSIATMRLQAQQMIARVLAGRFTASIAFNPYLIAGQAVKLESKRFKIPLTTARLSVITHQYQHGDCSTALNGLEVQQ